MKGYDQSSNMFLVEGHLQEIASVI